jgi:hypothetical protein
VRKLYSLPEFKILEVLDFVEFLAWNRKHLTSRQSENGLLREDEAFEAIADRLPDNFQMYAGDAIPVLPDYAVSRAGIYEEHL